MDLYEYQARDIFESYQVPVLPAVVAETANEAKEAAERFGGTVVIKAQVKTGGRGKAGGVKLAKTADEAFAQARSILGMNIKDHTVRRVMVAPGVAIAEEYYFSLVLDRANRGYLSMFSLEGGMEIEQLAAERPEALIRMPIDPLTGFEAADAEKIAAEAGFNVSDRSAIAHIFVKLWEVFKGEDATLVEVNPLVRTKSDGLIALDGKISLDDNARFRHPSHLQLVDGVVADPLEKKAENLGLNYVKLDGEIGIIGNGAGLVMSTLDVVAVAGERHGRVKPANFLDIGGGASAEVMASGLDVILGDPQVASVFVNVFGGITSCDAVATGIVRAMDILGAGADKPIVVRLDGNNVKRGREILAAANYPLITQADTMDEGADKAAELASVR